MAAAQATARFISYTTRYEPTKPSPNPPLRAVPRQSVFKAAVMATIDRTRPTPRYCVNRTAR